MKLDYSKLLPAVVICQLAGIIGSIFTMEAIPTWYATLVKPSFVPPNWLFAPVWTALYLMMGVALYLVVLKKGKAVDLAVKIFGVQLSLNILWSFIFFGQRNPMLAFFEIILLWLAILLTIVKFDKVSRPAALLMVPYLLWVTFAAYLNYSIWLLN